MIRLIVPTIDESDIAAVAEVLRTGFLVQGPRVAEFEKRFAAYVGVDHAVAVPNCTSALFLALEAIGVGAGDRVAVCTYSWPATANVIRLVGAEPVFVDIDPDTFNMDVAQLDAVLGRETVKAVMPVHTFGGAADMNAIMQLADQRGIPVIEDAACALGTAQRNRRAGSFGRMGCFSLHPRKAITTGEGGMITTRDPGLANHLRALRNHGQDPTAPRPDFIMPGHNMRMTEFQGAMGLTQMNKLERIVDGRIRLARHYDELLLGTDVRPPRALRDSTHVFQSYVVLLPTRIAGKRDAVIARMKDKGIETTLGTYHMPLTRYFRDRGQFKLGMFPVTDDVADRALTIPLYEGLRPDDQKFVVTSLLQAIGELS